MTELKVNINSFKFHKKDNSFLENINFDFKSKDLNFLIGMSGTGKTTILKIILGIYTDNINTKIEFKTDGVDSNYKQAQKLGLIGYISQTPSLIPWETINANIEIPSKLNRKLTLPSKEEVKKELNSVGLDDNILTLFPHQLSFGMQSRVAIVRTLLYKPKFLFLDELFTGIDTINSALIADKLKDYVKINDVVCLSITHDIDRAVNIADNIYLLDKGQSLYQIDIPFTSEKIINIINNQ